MAKCIVIAGKGGRYDGLRRFLKQEGYDVTSSTNAEKALRAVTETDVNVVLSDIELHGSDALAFLRGIKTADPAIEVIFLSSSASVSRIEEAMDEGAYDVLDETIEPNLINQVIKKALEKQGLYIRKSELEESLKKKSRFTEIIGKSRAIRRVLELVEKVSSTKSSILICGKSGTGKELVARAIHNSSPRWDKPFIRVHCAALNEGVLESELFGHEKGAFTGALKKRSGRFELAQGGTIFLDEVADIPLSTQIKLLRVLQEREFERVGGEETIKIDVRVVSATNRDLNKAVEEGTFREDLYYRLNVVRIDVPPLSERKEDIPLLVDHFVKRHNEESEHRVKGFTREAMRVFNGYHWPGNVRELENAMESAMALTGKDMIEARFLPSYLLIPGGLENDFYTLPGGLSLRELEEEIIRLTLERTGGNKTRAARQLGIGLRTLQRKAKNI